MTNSFPSEFLPVGVAENYISPPKKQGPNRHGLPYSNSANKALERVLAAKEQIDTQRAEIIQLGQDLSAATAAVLSIKDISAYSAAPALLGAGDIFGMKQGATQANEGSGTNYTVTWATILAALDTQLLAPKGYATTAAIAAAITAEGFGTAAYTAAAAYATAAQGAKADTALQAADITGKANVATTLAGYGIANAYTTAEVDGLLTGKANNSDVYTRTQIDGWLSLKADAINVYTKTEVDAAFVTSASPTFTGVPVAPTAALNTNNSQIATTEYVDRALGTLPGGGATNLNGLLDVTLTSPAAGHLLRNNGSGQFVNTLLAAGDIPQLAIAKISGLQTALDAKAAAAHTHVIADITDFTDNSSNWNTAFGWGDHSLIGYLTSASNVAWAQLTGVPDFSSDGHVHSIANITGLQTALDGKLDASGGALSDKLTISTDGSDDIGLSLISADATSFINFQDSGTSTPGNVRLGASGDNLVMWAGGAERLRLNSNGKVRFFGALLNFVGTQNGPGYAFDGDTNTGITQNGADTIRLVTGGTAALDIDASQNLSGPGGLTMTGAIAGSNINDSDWDEAYGWGDHSAVGYVTAAFIAAPAPQTANFTFGTNGERVLVNTASAAVTGTLPASPAVGTVVRFIDQLDTFETNNFTVARNGQLIESLAEDMLVETNGAFATLTFVGGSIGWKVRVI